MNPNVGPLGSRARILFTYLGSLTTQGPTASRDIGCLPPSEQRRTLKLTIPFAAQ